ncbi:hypothetical protein T492DRAFT_1140522, partial [Pavlovales sp. CCMP2436]
MSSSTPLVVGSMQGFSDDDDDDGSADSDASATSGGVDMAFTSPEASTILGVQPYGAKTPAASNAGVGPSGVAGRARVQVTRPSDEVETEELAGSELESDGDDDGLWPSDDRAQPADTPVDPLAAAARSVAGTSEDIYEERARGDPLAAAAAEVARGGHADDGLRAEGLGDRLAADRLGGGGFASQMDTASPSSLQLIADMSPIAVTGTRAEAGLGSARTARREVTGELPTPNTAAALRPKVGGVSGEAAGEFGDELGDVELESAEEVAEPLEAGEGAEGRVGAEGEGEKEEETEETEEEGVAKQSKCQKDKAFEVVKYSFTTKRPGVPSGGRPIGGGVSGGGGGGGGGVGHNPPGPATTLAEREEELLLPASEREAGVGAPTPGFARTRPGASRVHHQQGGGAHFKPGVGGRGGGGARAE